MCIRDSWNRVLIQLKGDDATLLVNDQKVATVKITDVASIRFPGLFRFADESNAKVRNVKYRGGWPTELPSVEEQELALNSENILTDLVKGETTVYDFSKSTDELKAAGLELRGTSKMETTAEGAKITARNNSKPGDWPSFVKRIKSDCDFDVSIDFADLKMSNASGWGCNLDLKLEFMDVDSENTKINLGIRLDKENALFINAQHEYKPPQGKRFYHKTKLLEPFESGTLRYVRRGGKIYAIIAAQGEPQRVVGTYTIGKKVLSKFEAVTKAATDSAELDAVLKKMSVTLDQ